MSDSKDSALAKRLAELEKRVSDLEGIAREQHAVIVLMRKVVEEYKDYKDPEENSWTAKNWVLKKNRLNDRAREIERVWWHHYSSLSSSDEQE